MAMPAENPLFDAPGAAQVILQHLHVVIGFEDEDVGGPNSLNHKLRGVSQVRQEANIPAWSSEQETNRIVGIMGNTERINFDIAGYERRACGK